RWARDFSGLFAIDEFFRKNIPPNDELVRRFARATGSLSCQACGARRPIQDHGRGVLPMSFRFARQLTAGLSMLALALAGCAQEREPINRVQADALAKSFFVGEVGNHDDDPEFYWRNFVVDASESQSLVGIGSWSGVDRIRWEITEHLLLARRSYQQNPGADDKGDRNGPPDGTLVAAYPI